MTLIPSLPDAANPLRQPLAAPLAWWRRGLQVLAWVMVSAWSLLLIAWLTLHWGILNHIEQWRPRIEARAGAAIGAKVSIGGISVRSGSWVPALEMRDVVVFDAQQREAIRLPHVFAALSPRSLLALSPRLSQLLIDGAQLDVRRDAAGRFFIGGLPIGSPEVAGDGGEAADWFFRQYEFVVRGGRLRWTDERRDAPPLVLSDVSLVVRNGLRRHDVRFDATPPPAWGSRFTLQGRFVQPLLARAGDWRLWSGPLQIDLPQADVGELRRYASLPFELSEGSGALRGWLEMRLGEPREATLDIALRSVALRLAADVEPMVFAEVQGRLHGLRDADGVSLRAEQFGFVTGDGLTWPRGDAQLSWRQRQEAVGAVTVAAPVTGGSFSADRLDLGLMAAVATSVPLGKSLHGLLLQFAPKGVVNDLTASWQGPLDAPDRYAVKSRITGLSLAAGPQEGPHGIGRPGLRQADIDLDADERGGTAALSVANGAIELPGVFEQPLIPLQRLAAQVGWTITPPPPAGAASLPQLEVKVQHASFANADAQSELEASWRTGPGEGSGKGGRFPGRLVLDGTLTKGLAYRVARYLPLGLPRHVRDYVAHAISGGGLDNASFHVKGDLAEFPYAEAGKAGGEFRITGRAEAVDLAYVPSLPASVDGRVSTPAFVSPWPAFTRVSADLVFDRASMEIHNGTGQVYGVALSGVQGGIRNLEDPTLLIDGTAQGPMSELLRYAAASPVDGLTGGALAPIAASGPGELKLSLAIPLNDTDKTTVKGSVALAGNDLRLRPHVPVMAMARGRVDFTQHGFAVVGATARLLGGEASFEGGSQADGSLRFNGQGVVSAEGLRAAASELGPAARLAGSLSGQAPYRLALRFVHGLPEFNLSSTLVGLGSDLPAPLGKSAEAALPLHVQNVIAPESLEPSQAPRDSLRAELGNLLRVQYERDLSHAEPQVLRGGIGVGEPAPQPSRGVQASVTLPALDADAWEAMAPRLSGNAGAGAIDPGSVGSGYLPTTLGLHLGSLNVASRKLTAVVAGISQSDGVWRANVDADQLNGYLEYRVPRLNNGDGLVYARLRRLVLPKTEAEGMENLLDQQPATVPALDLVIEDFQLRGLRLGRLEVNAVNQGVTADSTGEWRLDHFVLAMPEARLSGSGNWSAPAARSGVRRRAAMDFTLDLVDSGALLERLGLGKTLKGGKGRIAGGVAWLGSPLSPDFASMSGEFNLGVESGQFLKVDAGAARLLGVLSLQNLPRLLQFDFRDVFAGGFPFDSVAGDVRITQGVAATNNLRMRGAQAAVLMEGRADLARETQDLSVVVVPEINAGTASLAYAVINPAVGLGTFLAQLFLRKPMMQAATREFRITGSWSEPKVEPVERRFDAPIPEIEAAPASVPR